MTKKELKINNYIKIKVIGDSGPFSLYGNSISYYIELNNRAFLIDSGAPIFKYLTTNELSKIRGIVGTHLHDDHKRWFTDFILYKNYVNPNKQKIKLLTTSSIHREFKLASKIALENTLSMDSFYVVNIPYEDFLDTVTIGPKRKFEIVEIIKNNKLTYAVKDENKKFIPKNKIKVFINPSTKRKRLLYFDEKYKEWIDPDIFYSFKNKNYYYSDNIYKDKSGLKIRAVKSPSWHGIDTIGIILEYKKETIFFTSDTAFSLDLWRKLAGKTNPKKNINAKKYMSKNVIVGDINEFIERMWSKERLNEALKIYSKSDIVIQDIASNNSIVHTDYVNAFDINNTNLFFTHTPDKFVSFKPIMKLMKKYILYNKKLYELNNNSLYANDCDLYYKNKNRLFIGKISKKGKFRLTTKNNLLNITSVLIDKEEDEQFISYIDLFEDVFGRYFPIKNENLDEYILLDNDLYNMESKTSDKIILKKVKEIKRKILNIGKK